VGFHGPDVGFLASNELASGDDGILHYPLREDQIMAFKDCFKQNLGALGLPAPDSLFGDVTTAVATISTIAKAVATYGNKVTIADIAGASVLEGAVAAGLGEILGAVGAVVASFYLGACIGSLIACTIDWAFFSGGQQQALAIPDVQNVLAYNNIYLPDGMQDLLWNNPEMRGGTVADNYQARMLYYAYGTDNGGAVSGTAVA
jgi:hypothetical protein